MVIACAAHDLRANHDITVASLVLWETAPLRQFVGKHFVF